MKTQGIFFDLDGTLWDASETLLFSWNKTLARMTGGKRQLTMPELCGLLGKTDAEIAAAVFPDMPAAERTPILAACFSEELDYLRERGGKLYPLLRETLAALREKYVLAIVSNANDGYIQTFLAHYGLEPMFDDFEMAGRTGMGKGKNIRLVMERCGVGSLVFVGDTESDRLAAAEAGVPFIHAGYGFGKVTVHSVTAREFAEVPRLAERLLQGS